MRSHGRRWMCVWAVAATLPIVACKGELGATRYQASSLPDEGILSRIRQGPIVGPTVSKVPASIENPYDGNPAAINEGQILMTNMNCLDCHGYNLQGGMGPNLKDNIWRYGGADADIFNSIYEGRRQGMPAWGGMLSEKQIWEIVAFIRSQGGATGARYSNAAGTAATQFTEGGDEQLHGKRAPSEP